MAPIDAKTLHQQGALSATVRGLTARYIRESRRDAIVPDLAGPVLRLAAQLRQQGDRDTADRVIAHAVHDGITPTMLQEAQIVETVTAADTYRPLFVDNPAVDNLLVSAADTAAAVAAVDIPAVDVKPA